MSFEEDKFKMVRGGTWTRTALATSPQTSVSTNSTTLRIFEYYLDSGDVFFNFEASFSAYPRRSVRPVLPAVPWMTDSEMPAWYASNSVGKFT